MRQILLLRLLLLEAKAGGARVGCSPLASGEAEWAAPDQKTAAHAQTSAVDLPVQPR